MTGKLQFFSTSDVSYWIRPAGMRAFARGAAVLELEGFDAQLRLYGVWAEEAR